MRLITLSNQNLTLSCKPFSKTVMKLYVTKQECRKKKVEKKPHWLKKEQEQHTEKLEVTPTVSTSYV